MSLLITVNDDCRPNNGLGDCSTLCLPTRYSHTCACQEGVRLRSDGKTCEDSKYSRTSMARTSLGPWNSLVRATEG